MSRHALFYLNAPRQALNGYDTKQMMPVLGKDGTLDAILKRLDPEQCFGPDAAQDYLRSGSQTWASEFLRKFVKVYTGKKQKPNAEQNHQQFCEHVCSDCQGDTLVDLTNFNLGPWGRPNREEDEGEDEDDSDDGRPTHPGIFFSAATLNTMLKKDEVGPCWLSKALTACEALTKAIEGFFTIQTPSGHSGKQITDVALLRPFAARRAF